MSSAKYYRRIKYCFITTLDSRPRVGSLSFYFSIIILSNHSAVYSSIPVPIVAVLSDYQYQIYSHSSDSLLNSCLRTHTRLGCLFLNSTRVLFELAHLSARLHTPISAKSCTFTILGRSMSGDRTLFNRQSCIQYPFYPNPSISFTISRARRRIMLIDLNRCQIRDPNFISFAAQGTLRVRFDNLYFPLALWIRAL